MNFLSWHGANSTYQLRHDVSRGPDHNRLTFTTGALGLLPAVTSAMPMHAPTNTTTE
jgi:hypothetical protein